MTNLIIFLSLLKAGAVEVLDEKLSEILVREYSMYVSEFSYGKKILKEAQSLPKHIYLAYSDDGWLAWYEGDGRIFFNLKYLMIFFGIEDYEVARVIKVIKNSPQVRKEFIRYTDFLFIHELVHLIQDLKYPYFSKYRYEFAELEYEAFIKTDIYFYEKMKKNKTLFYKLLACEYYDLYSGYAMGGFISSFDVYNNYLESIKKRYLDEAQGYVSLSDEEKKRKIRVEEKKLLSYAGAGRKAYEKDAKEYEKMKLEMDVYAKDISFKLKKMWDKYTDEASYFVLDMAYKARNYLIFWKVYYFVKKVKGATYSDRKKDTMIAEFKKHIRELDFKRLNNEQIMNVIEEIYWFEKNFSSLKDYDDMRHSYYPQIIGIAIKASNSTDKKYVEMIDFISSVISI